MDVLLVVLGALMVLGDDDVFLTPAGTTSNNGGGETSREEFHQSGLRESRRRRSRAAPDSQPRRPRQPLHPPQAPPPCEINLLTVTPLFEKQLQESDVSTAGRIVLPKILAETYLPHLPEKDGLWMHLNDLDYMQVWTFKFRFWPNFRTRMYLFENTRDFTRTRGLTQGDYLIVYREESSGTYLVRGQKQELRVPVVPAVNNNSNNLNPDQVVEAQAAGIDNVDNAEFTNLEEYWSEIYGPDQNFQFDLA